MDGKNKIIEDIYKSKVIDNLLKNMGVSANDVDDLKQEIAVILLEYDEKKIFEMYEKKQIKFFLVKIIQHQYFSKTSPYYKKYKKYYAMIDGNIINNNTENERDNEDN